ncbi:MAG: error-prone DNA polymerase [Candidatus Promineifilaceae bacterium]|nr:error-prone DNA polymerase [Candidatus Promineifilaceae bacterium]
MSLYAELHCHSNFSLLDGANHPEDLVARAAELGMPALALTDHDGVYGAVRFIKAARQQQIKPILGAELTIQRRKSNFHLTLLVENQTGWHNLCYLISRARHAAPKGEAVLPFSELVGCTDGLIALSGCRQGEVVTALLQESERHSAVEAVRRYVDLFGPDHFWIELQRHFLPGEEFLVSRLTALAGYMGLGYVATNNVHYAAVDRHMLQDVLVCIRNLTTLDAATHLRRLNSEYYLKSGEQMAELFADHPQALENTLVIADRCHFDLNYGLQDLPQFPTPHGMNSSAYLSRLCHEAIPIRYKEPTPEVARQLNHELQIIKQAGLANYFLIVWDIVRFAREAGLRCQGRGSAANSLVAYLLFISPIDPIVHDLVFERFLSSERQVVPDIDIDFDAQRREEVIQYVYETYGADHTAMACTYVTFRSRSAIRDIGKVLGLAPDLIATAVQALEDQQAIESVIHAERAPLTLLLNLSDQIEGFPRHLGIHSGGMIITGSPMMGRVPTEPATMPDRVVVQWDKEALEEVGLVKIDILGLRMLSAISDAVELVVEKSGQAPDLDQLSFDDAAVFEMIGKADTIGVFQVESRAQAQMLPKLKPQCFGDLVIGISLIRPGPIQGNMVHPFLRRRQGLEPVTYAHPSLEPALAETLGVILFQEQVLKVARDMAGFTAGQGEQLRRALGAKRATEKIESFRDTFLTGALQSGVPRDVAELVFEQLLAFGGYSFAKSHAAAFSVLVYQSGWLKKYHPDAFYTALLNNQPMGFWNAAVLVNEIRRQGMLVLPIDIRFSRLNCSIEDEGIRLGLNYVKNLKEEQIECILTEREKEAFDNLLDFCRRTRINRSAVENIIVAGGMDGWGIPRRQLLWELGTLQTNEEMLDLVYQPEEVELPEQTLAESMLAEQEIMGLSPGDHVMRLFRARLQKGGILGSRELESCRSGQRAQVAGLLVVHQAPPTAKGFRFLTLEDEDGMINVIVRP